MPLRKHTAEPVIGNLNDRTGLRQIALRGLAKVVGEWSLACTAPEILKSATGTGRRAVPKGNHALISATG